MEDVVYLGRHVLQWHITHRCNLRCTHCYQRDYGACMEREELFAALDWYCRFLRSRSLRGHVNLTGGEPLTHPDFFPLAKEIRKRDLSLGVLTNGTLIDRRTAAALSDLDPDYVQLSLDGARRAHDAIRGKGSFDRALAAADLLKARGVRVHVSFTAQSRNLRQLPALERICRRHGVDKLWFDRVVIPREEDRDCLSLSTEDFRRLAVTAARLSKKGTLRCDRALQFLPGGRASCYHCGAGGDLLILLADGSLMPCRRLPFVIGSWRDGELAQILEESPVMRELSALPIPEDCRACPHAERCRGGAKCVTYAQTGRLDRKDVNCWLDPEGNE